MLQTVQKVLHLCERWVIRKVDLIVCSVGLEKYVKTINANTPVIEWYFPGQHVEVEIEEVNRLREKLAIAPDSPVVLYTGNFEPYQELHRLIEAAHRILLCLPKTVIVLVGGTDPDKMVLSGGSQDLLEAGSLRLLPPQPRSEISKFLALASILVSPRRNGQNLPLKIFDYLASGKPVVVMDSAPIRAILDQNIAMIVNPSTNELGEVITQLLQNPERSKQLGMAARDYAERHLGWKAFVELVSHIQDQVCCNGPQPRYDTPE